MKYTVIVVWNMEGNEIHSDVKTTKYPDIAKAFFSNFEMLMKMDPLLGINRVSLYADGNEIERTIIQNGSQIRNQLGSVYVDRLREREAESPAGEMRKHVG